MSGYSTDLGILREYLHVRTQDREEQLARVRRGDLGPFGQPLPPPKAEFDALDTLRAEEGIAARAVALLEKLVAEEGGDTPTYGPPEAPPSDERRWHVIAFWTREARRGIGC